MPFLIDSVAMELNRQGFGVHLIIHPVMRVRRDADGRLARGAAARRRWPRTPWPSRSSTSRSTRQTAADGSRSSSGHLRRVIGEVRAAVEDWPEMRERALELAQELEASPPPVARPEETWPRRARSWTGSRTTTSPSSATASTSSRTPTDDLRLRSVPGSGLGILRQAEGEPRAPAASPSFPAVRAPALEPYLLNLTKANCARHRAPARLPRLRRRQALRRRRARWSASAASSASTRTPPTTRSPRDIPVLRRKVEAVARARRFPRGQPQREGADRDPRDVPARRAVPDLASTSCSRSPSASCTSASASGCACSCAATPSAASSPAWCSCRATATTPRTAAHPGDPAARVRGARASTTPRESPSPCWCGCTSGLHGAGRACRTSTSARSRRGWSQRRARGATTSRRRCIGRARGGAGRGALPPLRARPSRPPTAPTGAARRRWPTSAASRSSPARTPDLAISLYRPLEAPQGQLRAKLFRAGAPLALSDMLPLFENLGVKVADERPYEVAPRDRDLVWIYDFGLTYPARTTRDRPRRGRRSRRPSSGSGRARPRTTATTGWCCAPGCRGARSAVLRAIGSYLRQAGTTFSDRYIEQTLARSPPAGRRCSSTCSTPASIPPATTAAAAERARRATSRRRSTPSRASTTTGSCAPSSRVVRAMLRTNYFQRAGRGAQAVPLVQARARRGCPWLPAPAPALRDLRLLAADGGRAPAGREGRAWRHPLVGPARGLPHRGPRPDEGPDGEERGDRAGRREGRLRGQAPAGRGRPRGAARGGRGLLPHVHQRPARRDRQHRRRRDRAAARRRALRRRRPVPGRRGRQGHGDLLRHRQRDLARVRVLAGRRVRLRRLERATTTRRWASPRAARGSR